MLHPPHKPIFNKFLVIETEEFMNFYRLFIEDIKLDIDLPSEKKDIVNAQISDGGYAMLEIFKQLVIKQGRPLFVIPLDTQIGREAAKSYLIESGNCSKAYADKFVALLHTPWIGKRIEFMHKKIEQGVVIDEWIRAESQKRVFRVRTDDGRELDCLKKWVRKIIKEDI